MASIPRLPGPLLFRFGSAPSTPWFERPDPRAVLESNVAELRRQLARTVHASFAGDAPAPTERRSRASDDGLFAPDSVTRRVHADVAMFIGGVRALLLQTMHPLAMAGVAEHSDYRHDALGRLARTGAFVGTTTYGSRDEAVAAVAMVKRVHRRVTGVAPDGRPYSANDPHLLTWVHHAEVDSFLAAYQRYGAEPLTAADADGYVDEMADLCELFEAEPAARSVAELRAYFVDIESEVRATKQARDIARWIMVPPLPWRARLAYGVIFPAALGLLPAAVRRDLWLPLAPGIDPLVVQPAARTFMRSFAWVMGGLEEDSTSDDVDGVPEVPAA